MLKVRL